MTTYDVGGTTWHVVARHFPTLLLAKRAWEDVERRVGKGDGDLGFLRLTPVDERGMPSGAPEGAHPVIAVTRKPDTARKVARLLKHGTEWTPTDDFARTLILHRIRAIAEQVAAAPGTKGRMTIRRPEGRGAHIYSDGTVAEPTPGQG